MAKMLKMMNFKEISIFIAKILLFMLNGTCVLISISTFVFALVDVQMHNEYGEEYASGTFNGDMVIIVGCWLVFSVATFGIVGVLKNNIKLLYLYIGALMITVILQFLVTVFMSIERYGGNFKISEWLQEDFFKNVSVEKSETHKQLWDQLQTSYECCGLNGPEDYYALRMPISLSCCPTAYKAKTDFVQKMLYRTCLESASYFSKGCEGKILEVLRSDSEWLQEVAVTSFLLEAVGMLLAMTVANNTKKNAQVYSEIVRY